LPDILAAFPEAVIRRAETLGKLVLPRLGANSTLPPAVSAKPDTSELLYWLGFTAFGQYCMMVIKFEPAY
jgi:hypothetical protein